VRDFTDESTAGTAFGVLGEVNGIGDLVSSLMVGLLWTSFGAQWGVRVRRCGGVGGRLVDGQRTAEKRQEQS